MRIAKATQRASFIIVTNVRLLGIGQLAE